MLTKTLTIKDPHGIHLRVAAKVVKASQSHQAEVVFYANGKKASASSILELLLLGVASQSSVTVVVTGKDEHGIMQQMEMTLVDGAGI
jgi:phosphocarrier protein